MRSPARGSFAAGEFIQRSPARAPAAQEPRLRGRCVALVVAALLGCTSVTARQDPRREEPEKAAVEAAAADPARSPAIALANPGFEALPDASMPTPSGWIAGQHSGEPSYTFRVDGESPRSGRFSARLDNIGPEPYGVLYQLLPAGPYVGQRLRFSADLRTRGAGSAESFTGAVLVLQAMQAGVPIAFERMADRILRGDQPWARYAVELTLPPGSQQVQVGVMLMGNGTVWMDQAALEVIATP